MATQTKRITITLPTVTVRQITHVAHRCGVSRSTMMAAILEEPVADLFALVNAVPPDPTGDDVAALAQRSVGLAEERLDALRAALAGGSDND